jgi:hypothetical protein
MLRKQRSRSIMVGRFGGGKHSPISDLGTSLKERESWREKDVRRFGVEEPPTSSVEEGSLVGWDSSVPLVSSIEVVSPPESLNTSLTSEKHEEKGGESDGKKEDEDISTGLDHVESGSDGVDETDDDDEDGDSPRRSVASLKEVLNGMLPHHSPH